MHKPSVMHRFAIDTAIRLANNKTTAGWYDGQWSMGLGYEQMHIDLAAAFAADNKVAYIKVLRAPFIAQVKPLKIPTNMCGSVCAAVGKEFDVSPLFTPAAMLSLKECKDLADLVWENSVRQNV